jgi:hypothetical protein
MRATREAPSFNDPEKPGHVTQNEEALAFASCSVLHGSSIG